MLKIIYQRAGFPYKNLSLDMNYELKWWFHENRFSLIYYGLSLGLFLILRSVFYNAALYTTLFLTFIPPFIMYFVAKNDSDVGKTVLYTWLLTLLFFITILVLVVKFLYIMFVIALIVAQDIAYKIVHYLKFRELFKVYESHSISDYILYSIPFLNIIAIAAFNYPSDIIEQINITSLSEIVINNFEIEALADLANIVHKYGIDNLKSLRENILKISGYAALISVLTYGFKIINPFENISI